MGVLVLMDQVFWVRSTDCSPANPSARTTNKVRCATVIPAMCGGRSVGVIGNVALIRRGGSTVSGLPSFLGFLFLEGLVEVDFSQAALAVHRRQSSLPRGIAKSEVQAILRSCDRRSALGRRDYAMVLLLVRLGLRRGEVAALRLDDVDWRAGELVVRGKRSRSDRCRFLPTWGGRSPPISSGDDRRVSAGRFLAGDLDAELGPRGIEASTHRP